MGQFNFFWNQIQKKFHLFNPKAERCIQVFNLIATEPSTIIKIVNIHTFESDMQKYLEVVYLVLQTCLLIQNLISHDIGSKWA